MRKSTRLPVSILKYFGNGFGFYLPKTKEETGILDNIPDLKKLSYANLVFYYPKKNTKEVTIKELDDITKILVELSGEDYLLIPKAKMLQKLVKAPQGYQNHFFHGIRLKAKKGFKPDESELIKKLDKHMVILRDVLKYTTKDLSQVTSIILESSSEVLQQSFSTIWDTFKNNSTEYEIIIGETNSGKTHYALTELSQTNNGVYLAPLRLLAWEIYETLNIDWHKPTSLLTGEEEEYCVGQEVVSSTIEMFNNSKEYDLVVIDEMQMVADRNRGWAWLNALLHAKAKKVIVIGSPNIKGFLLDLFEKLGKAYTLKETKRKCDLKVADKQFKLNNIPKNSILIAFSRREVLNLDKTLSKILKRRTSIIYGALPPDVRKKQAKDFLDGTTDICIATDAIAMGLNLPAKYLFFTTLEKFDGKEYRALTEPEVKQIAGRAGRYGLFDIGYYGGIGDTDNDEVHAYYSKGSKRINQAILSPTIEDLIALDPHDSLLGKKLRLWEKSHPVPKEVRHLFAKCDLTEAYVLARALDENYASFPLEIKMSLARVPVKKDASYWYKCVDAIFREKALPLPRTPTPIESAKDLEYAENLMGDHEIYCYLSNREAFKKYASMVEMVKTNKAKLSDMIYQALVDKISLEFRCQSCGEELENNKHKMCDTCFHENRSNKFGWEFDG